MSNFGQDLDAAGNRVEAVLGVARQLLHVAVDPQTHSEVVLLGLHMQVGGASRHRLRQHAVHQFDGGAFLGQLAQQAQIVAGHGIGGRGHAQVLGHLFEQARCQHGGRQRLAAVLQATFAQRPDVGRYLLAHAQLPGLFSLGHQ
jgi:hypothetical protein